LNPERPEPTSQKEQLKSMSKYEKKIKSLLI